MNVSTQKFICFNWSSPHVWQRWSRSSFQERECSMNIILHHMGAFNLSLTHINASFIWVCWELNHCETYLKLPFKQPGMLWLLRWNKFRYQENDQQQRTSRSQMSPRRSWRRASSAGTPANDEAAWPFNHLRTNRSRFSLTNHTRRDPATTHINQADSPKSWSENERTPNTK